MGVRRPAPARTVRNVADLAAGIPGMGSAVLSRSARRRNGAFWLRDSARASRRPFRTNRNGLDDRSRSRAGRNRVRAIDGVSFSGGMDGLDLSDDASGQNARSPALHFDRPARDARALCQVFHRGLCRCVGNWITGHRTRQVAAIALARVGNSIDRLARATKRNLASPPWLSHARSSA